jgi:hypothetical protein
MGDVAIFDIFVESLWLQKIPGVYLESQVLDSEGKSYAQYKTYPLDLGPKEKQVMQVYWETSTAAPGDYILKTTLNYGGKTSENTYKIRASLDKMETQFTGEVISGQSAEQGNPLVKWMTGLTFLIVILIAFNIYIFMIRGKKRKG